MQSVFQSHIQVSVPPTLLCLTVTWGPCQQAAPTVGLGWGLRLCITNKLPGMPGPRTTPRVEGSKLLHCVPMTPM